jgi:hypothetical protein
VCCDGKGYNWHPSDEEDDQSGMVTTIYDNIEALMGRDYGVMEEDDDADDDDETA